MRPFFFRGNGNISQSAKVKSGRSQDSKNFVEDELAALVALVHDVPQQKVEDLS